MIFYVCESESQALELALQDPEWSETEKKSLAEILKYVQVKEENQYIMTTEEWINNPTDLSWKLPRNLRPGKWTNGENLYTALSQKYMIFRAGNGYHIGKIYPEPDDVLGKS